MGYKLVISDQETGKSYQMELDEKKGEKFIGLNMGSEFDCSPLGMPGYKAVITGGTDSAGFPMKKGIHKERVGVLVSGADNRKRKLLCGETINPKTVQINTKITKKGTKPLEEIFVKTEKAEKKK